MTDGLSRERSIAASATLHPIFLGNKFIDDSDIYSLVSKVMYDETSDPTPLGGLSGRLKTEEGSCFLVAIMNSIYTLFLKVWHFFRMSCSSEYHKRFIRAAQLITSADLENQEMLEAAEARRVAKVRKKEEEAAATTIQSCFRTYRIQKAYNAFKEAASPLKANLEAKQRNLIVCSENVRNQENILSAYIQDCNQSRLDEPKHLGHRIWRWLTCSKKLDAPRVDLACQARFRQQFNKLSITEAQGAVASEKQREQQFRAEVLELERQVNEQKTTFLDFCGRFSYVGEEVSDLGEIEIIEEPPQVETCQDAMFLDIAEKAHPQLATLLKMAFDKFKEEKVASWTYNEKSKTYKIILEEPFQMWVPAVDDQGAPETTGGAVILFGHDTQGTIILKLDPQSHSIHFEGGTRMYFYYWTGMRNTHYVPIVSLQYLSDSDKIRLTIDMGFLGGRQARDKSLRNFEVNWQDGGEIIDDYKASINEKMKSRAQGNDG